MKSETLAFRASFLGLALTIFVLLPAVIRAGDVERTNVAATNSEIKILLEQEELTEPVETFALQFSAPPRLFAKEPDFGNHRVVRGRLGFGGATNEFTGFAWDQTANRLYLDLNGNQDLTDDSKSPLAGEYDGYLQLFPRVELSLQSSSGKRSRVLDLRLGGTNPNQMQGTAALRSIWQTRLELGGRAYQVGLAENPVASGGNEAHYFLFRPWEARTEPLRLNPGTPHLVSWSQKVFLAGRAFSLALSSTNQSGDARFVLTLRPVEPELGRLRAAGQFLYRLTLQDPAGYLTILDAAAQEELVPVGRYQKAEVWLRHGAGEAFYIGELPVSVRPNAVTALDLNGSLTNVVAVQRRGDDLALTYHLAGPRGLDFRMTSDERTNPPSWKILAGDKELASGRFAYG